MIDFAEIADLLNPNKFEGLFRNCPNCGSDRFERCGIQEQLNLGDEPIYQVNCFSCHSTLSTSKKFYDSLPEHTISDDGCFVNQRGEQDV